MMIERSANTSEKELIEIIASGNGKAINTLYLEYYPLIRHFIEKNSGDEESAKDIYQDGVVILIRNIRNNTFRGESSIKTYLYSVCRRLWLKELHHRKIKVKRLKEVSEYINDEENPEDPALDEKLKKMSACMKELGEPCYTILSDFYLDKLSMEDIRKKMGYTNSGNAKNQKYKCLQRLKKLFFKPI